ncbi:hypothetical protein ACHAW5_005672 [Stephanodiscus triporus]|uniref:Methyltransferase domain-containing protein n=1 Tax=Stephanodiscus triporus TaxID=2934178 RepID=A0ABD3NTC3_9STRA
MTSSRLALLAALRIPPPPSVPGRASSSSSSSLLRAAATARSESLRRPPPKPILSRRPSSSSWSGGGATVPPLDATVPSSQSSTRRRRRRDVVGGIPPRGAVVGVEATANDDRRRDDDGSDDVPPPSSAGFAPRDPITGQPLDVTSYLALATLSPWVPCPDAVVRRVLEVANVGPNDVHVDLGCGDGRLCFAAMDPPFVAKESYGVDVDPNVLAMCREREGRRFVPDLGGGGGGGDDGRRRGPDFLLADLVKVVDEENARYQRRLSSLSSSSKRDDNDDDATSRGRAPTAAEDEVARRMSRTTVVTAYLVDDALRRLRPYLASVPGGRDDVRVVTVGYEIGGGWEANWAEGVLGLTIFRNDMGSVSNEPIEWSIGKEEEEAEEEDGEREGGGGVDDRDRRVDRADHLDYDDGSSEVEEYLERKRARDAKELDVGLRIHHDEALNEFAGARRSRRGAGGGLEEEEEEEGWDFDETEDPAALMEEARRSIGETRADGVRVGIGSVDFDGMGRRGQGKGGDDSKAPPTFFLLIGRISHFDSPSSSRHGNHGCDLISVVGLR